MKISSPHFKAFTVTAGLSLWFFVITTAAGFFSLYLFAIFVIPLAVTTYLLAGRLERALQVLAVINTKIFLTVVFVFVVSIYGMIFRMLRIDLLRIYGSSRSTYWLSMKKDRSKNKLVQF